MSLLKNKNWLFSVQLPQSIALEGGETVDREEWIASLSYQWGELHLEGVFEGDLECDQAFDQGLEVESWVVDAGLAPHGRDWVQGQDSSLVRFYFSSLDGAEAARGQLLEIGFAPSVVEEMEDQNWNQKWMESFQGIDVAPFWMVCPPWRDPGNLSGKRLIWINPGSGFGTGTHETTQLCLQAIGTWVPDIWGNRPFRALDFGSGSGILSIGVALLGGQVDAVEIDPLANDNARENCALNKVSDQVRIAESIPEGASQEYDLIVANILKPILLDWGEELSRGLKPGGRVILSGLIEPDLREVVPFYEKLTGRAPQILSKGEWRALLF